MYDKQRVVATASGPTFATEDKTVHILLLTGMLLCFLFSVPLPTSPLNLHA